MILVPAEARPSPIHGLGCFALEDVRAGTVVARWTMERDYVLTPKEWLTLPYRLRLFLEPFVWIGEDGWTHGTSDVGRFTNHSTTPNLRYERGCGMIAARDISVGEEFTEDYGEYDASFDPAELASGSGGTK